MIRSRNVHVGLICLAAAGAVMADEPRMNQIQVIGTHNSYHIAPHPNVMGILAAGKKGVAEGLDYTHKPLAEQFSRLGIRQVELDVFADPKGGHYADPFTRNLLKTQGKEPGPDPNSNGRLAQPGMKVFHVQDVDYMSTVPTLVDALKEIRAWSLAHPRHMPIMILIELKDGAIVGLPTRPVAFRMQELDAVDTEIRSVFKPDAMITPDAVRGSSDTLRDAIQTQGWPTLESARGKVIFALDNEGSLRDLYLKGHESLQGRAMFATVGPDPPAAAWMKINDPIRDFDHIRAMVRAGFLVRTRADADTRQARQNDPTQRDKALASGAQYVSTDYPEPRREWSEYQVRLPGGAVARSNPVLGQPSDVDLEAIATRR
jgi:hypothetical protein